MKSLLRTCGFAGLLGLFAAGCKPAQTERAGDSQSIEAIVSAGAVHGNYRLGCGNGRKEVSQQTTQEAFQAAYSALPPTFKFFFSAQRYSLLPLAEVKTRCAPVLGRARSSGQVVTQASELDSCWLLETDNGVRVPKIYLANSPQSIHARLLATTAAAFDEYYVRGFRERTLTVQQNGGASFERFFADLNVARIGMADLLLKELDQTTRSRISNVFPQNDARLTFLFAETVDAVYCSRISFERFLGHARQTGGMVSSRNGLISLLGTPWWIVTRRGQ